ncbi:hypothetical protein JHD49_01560 [Sulfurimonas sp. SAG-AH-194-C21]|nr:hypothetical protein [Sulfurimonas sp. SAG-AH-194-C21]MDF1882622.1 hypothetical protein [Sulfurimonas sp. SAG-AH-194-C21]
MISSVLGSINTSNEIYDLLNGIAEEKIENNDIKEKQQKALVLVKENIGLIEFKGETDAYWKDLETSDVKVMVLSIPANTFIRSANDLKQELSAEDVNGNFLILDGLAYKSNINTKSIVYMKV